VDVSSSNPASAPVEPPPPDVPAPTESPVVGTDPTGVVPLPMAGLERTGGHRIPAAQGPRGPGARHAPADEGSRSLTLVLLVALVVVAAAAAGLWWITR
jgi:hypothetical protein